MSQLILNFHGTGPVTKVLDPEEFECWLETDFLESVFDLVCGQRHVRLTVDDGNLSDIEVILPALLRRGLQATFFVCSGRLDRPSFLSRSHIRELRANGMQIGSHGVDHVSWRHLSQSRLRAELEDSKEVLEEVCGTRIDSAACPLGAYDRHVIHGLRRAGYRQIYTSDDGYCADHDWIRARKTVIRTTNLDDLHRLVHQGVGAWKQSLISARKLIKRFR